MADIGWAVSFHVGLSLGLWGGYTRASPACPPRTYPDPVTGSCKDCSAICNDAEAHSTENICTFYCPDYNRTNCTPGYFFNSALNKCGRCTVHCTDNNPDSLCRKECTEVLAPDKSPKHLTDGMVALYVFIAVAVLALVVYVTVCLLRSNHRLPWSSRNPYRRPQTSPDEFDDPHSVISSHDELEILEDQKDQVGFSDLKMTIQNPMT